MDNKRNNTSNKETEIPESFEKIEVDGKDLNCNSPEVEGKSQSRFQDGEKIAFEEESKNKKKRKRTTIFRFSFILISVIVIATIFFLEFQGEDMSDLFAIISTNPKSYYLIFAFLAIALVTLFQSLRMNHIIRVFEGKSDLRLAYKVTAIGRYYDSLTPSSLGGQPAQIYYFHKSGKSGSASSGMTVIYFLAYQFAFISFGLFAFISNTSLINYGGINVLGYIGLSTHIFLPLIVIFASINDKIWRSIVGFVFAAAVKLKIMKPEKKGKKMQKTISSVEAYSEKLKYMFSHFFSICLPQLILTLIEVFLFCLVPYFCIVALGGSMEYSPLQYITLYVFMHCASSLMPTPGMTGGAELIFLTVFAVTLQRSPLFWALVIWRLLTFYFYLIQGFFITLADAVKKSKRENTKLKEEFFKGNEGKVD